MSFQRIVRALVVAFFSVAGLCAQDAQEIIDAVSKVYSTATSYSADVESRTLYFMFPPSPEGANQRYQVTSTHYRRLRMKVRLPQEYLLATQTFSEGSQGAFSSGGMATAPVSWSVLARSESTAPQQGVVINGQYSVREMPSEQFNSLVNSRLNSRGMPDLVLKHFQTQPAVTTTNGALGLREPELIGRENRGRPTYRINARGSDGNPVMLWVEEGTYLIVRSIVQRPRLMRTTGAAGPMGTPVPPSAQAGGGSSYVTVIETFYNNQRMDPPLNASDFVIPARGGSEPRPAAEQMGFGSVADLVKQAEVGPLKTGEPGGMQGPENEEGEAAAPNPTKTPGPPPTVQTDAQALTYEQMSGIVLIDGEGGTATGFMTKIRDVDFVVTNQHVLVGNKKITLKSLRGEEIPVLGIFGAIGSDVAILRIGKGEGDLKIAADVFKTSKIGDKVVVVGNRRGGGVATQTSGSIKGIGPNLVEVDANFQSGNSGSPIVNLSTNEVVGVATYSETRRVDVDEGRSSNEPFSSGSSSQVEKRWFGYRLDGLSKWEAIDLAKWNAQGQRIQEFRELSEALHQIVRFDFKNARTHPKLTAILDGFDSRYRNTGGNSVTAAIEVKDLFRVIRTISDTGVRDLGSGDYYDYYRTCQYWENSIPAQIEYRKAITEVLKKYESNSSLYLSRMRGN